MGAQPQSSNASSSTTRGLWRYYDRAEVQKAPVTHNVVQVEITPSIKRTSGSVSVTQLAAVLAAGDPDFHQGVREERKVLAEALYGGELSLKTLRLRRGMSQTDLADKIGSRQPNIYRYENGLQEPGLSVLAKLATALEVDIGDLAKAMLRGQHD